MGVQSSPPESLSKEANSILMMVNFSALGSDLRTRHVCQPSLYPPQVYEFTFRNLTAKLSTEGSTKRERSLFFGEEKSKEKEKEKPDGSTADGTGTGGSTSGGAGTSGQQQSGDPGDRGQDDDQGPKSKKIPSRTA